jgi:anti-sigma B factor antagonist
MSATLRVQHIPLAGELDPIGAPRVAPLVGAALDDGADVVVLHLEDVTFIDSTGLRALLDATAAADATGAELRILPGPAPVMEVVEAAGLLGRLPFISYP